MKCFLWGHEWYYAKGRSLGVLSNTAREGCVRRQCKTCGKKQQVSRFADVFVVDGDFFNGRPEWIDGHDI